MSEPSHDSAAARTDPEEVLKRLRAGVHRGAAPGDGDGERIGRYTVVEEIARGGMGVILKVRDAEMRRSLAVKVLQDREGATGVDSSLESQRSARFLEEAQVTGQLDHPGIVPVHEVGLDAEDRLYFSMRLVRGRTLDEIIALARAEEEGWTRTRALGVLLKVCEAMAFAHDRGVIHRDLKPANVMVGRFGETYVMDWGLAKILGQADTKDIRLAEVPAQTILTSTRKDESGRAGDSPLTTLDGDVIGTPAYMAPEQALGRVDDVGPLADVYSVGCMLYHLLAGHAPYVKDGALVPAHMVLQWALEGPPRPVHELAPDVPAELAAVCEKAMARDTAQRYPSMLALADDLQAFIEGRVVRAYETGALAEFKKWVARNRGMAASLAAAIVLGFVGLAAVLFVQTRSKAELSVANVELRETNQALAEATEAAEHNAELARASEAEMRWQSYVANVTAASASLDLGAASDAEARLAQAGEEHRGWEWRFLQNRTDASRMTLEGSPESFVNAVAWAPDGRHFATGTGSVGDTGGTDFRVRVWSSDGTPRHALEGHVRTVLDLAFSPSGTEVASASDDGTVRVWDVESGAQLAMRRGDALSIAYHPEGLRIAMGGRSGTVVVWDMLRDESVFQANLGEVVRRVAFSPDGERLALGTNGSRVEVRELPTGRLLAEGDFSRALRRGFSPGRMGGVVGLEFDPEGDALLVALEDGGARVWSPADGTTRVELDVATELGAAALSPGGDRVVTAGPDATVRLWDATSGRELEVLSGHDGPVYSVAVSPDGDRIVSGSKDRTVRLWDGRPGSSVTTISGVGVNNFQCYRLAFDAEGRRLAWTNQVGHEVRVTDARTGEDLLALPYTVGFVRGLAFSADGARLTVVAEADRVRTWDARTGELLEVSAEPRPASMFASFDAASERFVSCEGFGGTELRVVVRSVPAGEVVRTWPVETSSWMPCFSPDGARVLAPCEGGRMLLFDVGSGELVGETRLDGQAFDVSFSPDGERIAATTYDVWNDRLWLWEPASGELSWTRGHDQPSVVSFLPDGRRVVTGQWDGTLSLWDPARGEIVPLRGHGATVMDVLASPGGERIASLDGGGELRIWETTPVAAREAGRREAARREVLARRVRPIVAARLERLILPSAAVESLEADASLSDELRAAAIRLVRTTPLDIEPRSPESAAMRAMGQLVDPDLSPTDYVRLLELTELVLDLVPDPDAPEFRGSRGFHALALYRMGRVEDALAEAQHGFDLHGGEGFPPPPDGVVLALCLARLGRGFEAEPLLRRHRAILRALPPATLPVEEYGRGLTERLMVEAEALIEGR